MLPYWFSGMTLYSVSRAAHEMAKVANEEIKKAVQSNWFYTADSERCIKVSTHHSLKEMMKPGMLVIGTPLVCGFLFGKYVVAGIMAGSILSGVLMAISASNSGGAWDNCKKQLESEGLKKTPA